MNVSNRFLDNDMDRLLISKNDALLIIASITIYQIAICMRYGRLKISEKGKQNCIKTFQNIHILFINK